MRKLLQAAAGSAVFILLPLAWRIDLLFTWPVILAAAAGLSVHLVHPYTPVRELSRQNPHDRGSIWLMIFSAGVFFAACLIDAAYLSKSLADLKCGWGIAGIALVMAGFGVRLWTVRVLGSYFTARVTLHEEHQIIDAGPYRYLKIRHPAYLGTLLTALGIPMILRSPVGFVFYILLFLPVYLYRIHVEEKALQQRLGGAYDAFSKKTRRLIPFLY